MMGIMSSAPSSSAAPSKPALPHELATSRIVLALAIAVLAFSLMQTLLVPALPLLAREFGLDASGNGWILTSFLLSGAVAAPLLGSLGDRFGHRRLLLVSLAAFIVGSIVCIVAPTFAVLMLGRVLQGASTASFPLGLAIVRKHLPSASQQSAIGWLSGVLGLGAGIALVLGGLIAQFLSWQWLFILGTAVGIVAALLVTAWAPQSQRGQGTHTDWLGGALLVVSLLSLLIAISQGSSWGWLSPATLGLAIAAVAGIVCLVAVECRVAAPLVDIQVLGRPVMLLTNALTLLIGFVPYLFYVGLPVLFEARVGIGHDMAVSTAGLAMLPCAVLMFLGGRLAPALLGRMRAWLVGSIALVVMAVGAAGVALAPTNLAVIVCLFSLVGLGNGIALTVTSALVSQRAPRSEVAAAVAVNSVVRTVGASLGAPVAGLFLIDSTMGAGEFAALFAFAALVCLAGCGVAAVLRRHS